MIHDISLQIENFKNGESCSDMTTEELRSIHNSYEDQQKMFPATLAKTWQ